MLFLFSMKMDKIEKMDIIYIYNYVNHADPQKTIIWERKGINWKNINSLFN